MAIRVGKMEGAGPYYGIPLEELDAHLQWNREEELMIERFCEKIRKNIAEEKMTPLQRFEATLQGKERDRLLVEVWYFPLYAIRTLDSWSDALKPIDCYRYPKIHVLAHLATVARFKMDTLGIDAINYAENMFGWDAKLIEYGNPVTVGEPPIKSIEDLEGLELPDPTKHGLYPQYLWTGREIRRIFAKYGLDKLMPIRMSTCSEAVMTTMIAMLGMTQFLIGVRRNPELCQRAMTLATEWVIKYSKAVIEVCDPTHLFCCGFLGIVPYKGNEWMALEDAKVGKAIGPLRPASWGWALAGSGEEKWLKAQWETGCVGPGSFAGIQNGSELEYKSMGNFLLEHDLFGGIAISDKTLLSGPLSAIEEEIKLRAEQAKSRRDARLEMIIGTVDYWTPQAHLDFAIETAKKYGKF